MADINRKEPRALSLKRAEQRTAELNFAIARLETRKMEIQHEVTQLEESIAVAKASLEEHTASSKNI
jgi:hypothetical protein